MMQSCILGGVLKRAGKAALVAALLATPGYAGEAVAEATSAVAEAQEAGPIISLNYRRVPLERVLEYLSRSSRVVNIKISVNDEEELEELRRMLVTVELSNVTWRTALDFIANKYKFVVNDEGERMGVVLMERPPRVTLDVKDAEIGNVIKLIAAEAGANIIIDPDVSGQISFNLRDVPWQDALDSILKAKGYVKVDDAAGIIRITTRDKVDTQHEVRAVALRFLQPGGTRFKPLINSEYLQSQSSSETDVASSLLGVLEKLKSPEGAITYEQRTNMIIIKDTTTNIDEMVKVINRLDREPLQVKIKVRMIKRELTNDKDIGVDWNAGLTGSVTGSSYSTPFPFWLSRTGRNTGWGGVPEQGPFAAAFGSTLGPWPLNKGAEFLSYIEDPEVVFTDAYNAMTLGRLSFEALGATLKVFQENKDFTVMQAPEVIAMDNQAATINIGTITRYAEYYVETTDAGSSSGFREVGTPVVEGVQLIIVPHVCGDGDKVIMEVVPKTETVKEWRTFGAGQPNGIELPQTEAKVVVTKMLLKDRETGIIGGLIEREENDTVRKVPVLGDLPVLGRAFRYSEKSNKKVNHLFFVTPNIIGPQAEEDFGNELDELRDLAGALEGIREKVATVK